MSAARYPIGLRRIRRWAEWDPALTRLLVLVVVILAGYLLARSGVLVYSTESDWYMTAAHSLLAFGLFGSAYGIKRSALPDIRTIVTAITVGVALKAALISAVMVGVLRDPAYLVIAVAVAQIDPLSVAALQRHSRLSDRAKSVLAAWASFDDPITVLCAIYASGLALGPARAAELGFGGDAGEFLLGLVANLVFAAVAYLVWWSMCRAEQALRNSARLTDPVVNRLSVAVILVVLAVLFVVAVWKLLFLGLAMTALFFRPSGGGGRFARAMETVVDRGTGIALLAATILLGTLLVDGVEVGHGVLLGVAAFTAQALVGPVISRRLTRSDRVRLALGQQNGITSIILALSFQPVLPVIVAVVAPAIVVVNVLHIVTNFAYDRLEDHRSRGTAPGPRFRERAGHLFRAVSPTVVTTRRRRSAGHSGAGRESVQEPRDGSERGRGADSVDEGDTPDEGDNVAGDNVVEDDNVTGGENAAGDDNNATLNQSSSGAPSGRDAASAAVARTKH